MSCPLTTGFSSSAIASPGLSASSEWGLLNFLAGLSRRRWSMLVAVLPEFDRMQSWRSFVPCSNLLRNCSARRSEPSDCRNWDVLLDILDGLSNLLFAGKERTLKAGWTEKGLVATEEQFLATVGTVDCICEDCRGSLRGSCSTCFKSRPISSSVHISALLIIEVKNSLPNSFLPTQTSATIFFAKDPAVLLSRGTERNWTLRSTVRTPLSTSKRNRKSVSME